VYQGQRDHERGLSELDEDLYQLDLGPGLSQVAFDARVREALGTNPIIEHVRASGQQLRKEDVSGLLEDLTPDDYSADYMWDVLTAWIAKFSHDLITKPLGETVIEPGRKA
jgi:hypothetical protein